MQNSAWKSTVLAEGQLAAVGLVYRWQGCLTSSQPAAGAGACAWAASALSAARLHVAAAGHSGCFCCMHQRDRQYAADSECCADVLCRGADGCVFEPLKLSMQRNDATCPSPSYNCRIRAKGLATPELVASASVSYLNSCLCLCYRSS